MRQSARALVIAITAVGAVLFAACGSSGAKTSTPLAGERLSNRTGAKASDSCVPVADPLAPVLPALVRITTPPDASGSYSSGTGLIIDQGWVLTNQHVIESANGALVRTYYLDGHQSPGKVVAADADLDLALVQADTGTLPSATWGDEGHLELGATLFAVGYAGGSPLPIKENGRYVQTTVDRQTGQAFIVSDLQLHHGDSGGPLLNRCGQVIGINTARIQNAIGLDRNAGLSIPGFGARRWAIRNRGQ